MKISDVIPSLTNLSEEIPVLSWIDKRVVAAAIVIFSLLAFAYWFLSRYKITISPKVDMSDEKILPSKPEFEQIVTKKLHELAPLKKSEQPTAASLAEKEENQNAVIVECINAHFFYTATGIYATTGRFLPVTIEPDDTFLDMKKKIASMQKGLMPIHMIHFFIGDVKFVNDDWKLSDYGIKKKDSIEMVFSI